MEMSPSLRCDAPHPKLNFRERRACELRRTLDRRSSQNSYSTHLGE